MSKKFNNPNDRFRRNKSTPLEKKQKEIDAENKLKKLQKKLNPKQKKQFQWKSKAQKHQAYAGFYEVNNPTRHYGGIYGQSLGNHTVFNNPPQPYYQVKGFIGPHPEDCDCLSLNCLVRAMTKLMSSSLRQTIHMQYINVLNNANYWHGFTKWSIVDEEEEEMYTIITWDPLMDAYSLVMKDIERYNWKNVKPVLDAFKTMVPASARNFDFDTKVWHFQEQFLDGVKVLFETIQGNKVEVTKKPEYSPKVNLNIQTPDIVIFAKVCNIDLEEAKKLDLNSAKKVYRQAAMIYHPDKNNSNEAALKMSELNEVWNRLKTGYFLNELTARV